MTMSNAEQQFGVCTLPGNMCYENKLMVASTTNIQHPSEAIYLTVREAENPCTGNTDEERWYRKYITWRRAFDSLLTIIIMGFTILVEFGYVPHVNQGYYCADPSISHRFTGDTITANILAIVTFMGPLLIIYLVENHNRRAKRPSFSKIWLWYRGYLICLVAFLLLCQTLKVSTGEHRPHFLHTCAPDSAETCSPGDYITEYRCLNTGGFKGYIVPDSSLSFPSGHAGVATITSFFCAVFIHKRFNIRRIGLLAKPAMIALVLSWGFIVCISRVQDHRHHWWDVLVGAALGLSFSAYSIIFHCNAFIVPANREEKACISTIHCNYNKQHVSTSTLVQVESKDGNNAII